MPNPTSPHATPSPVRLGFLRGLFLIALSCALGLGFVEILCRLLDPLGISYFPETARYMDTLVLADGVGYHHQPGLKGEYWGAPVSINSLALRDEEVPLPRPANEFRILVMGDSWPFGIGVSHEQTFTYQLQQHINAHASGAMRARTVNMGVPSYNTEAELAQWESLGSKLEPNLVLLMFTLNDIEPKMWIFNKRQTWYVDWAQRSYAASFFFRSLRNSIGDSVVGSAANAQAGDMTGDFQTASPRWQAIDVSLTRLHNLLQARGVPLAVFSEAGPATDPGRLLAAVCQRENILLTPVLPGADPRWKDRVLQLVNSPSDGHPNPEGNQAVATLLYENLERLGLLTAVTGPHN